MGHLYAAKEGENNPNDGGDPGGNPGGGPTPTLRPATLRFDPAEERYDIEDTFEVDVVLDPGDQYVRTLDVEVEYTTTVLTFVSGTIGADWNDADVNTEITDDSGTISFTCGALGDKTTADTLVATLTFSVVKAGEADLDFGSGTDAKNSLDESLGLTTESGAYVFGDDEVDPGAVQDNVLIFVSAVSSAGVYTLGRNFLGSSTLFDCSVVKFWGDDMFGADDYTTYSSLAGLYETWKQDYKYFRTLQRHDNDEGVRVGYIECNLHVVEVGRGVARNQSAWTTNGDTPSPLTRQYFLAQGNAVDPETGPVEAVRGDLSPQMPPDVIEEKFPYAVTTGITMSQGWGGSPTNGFGLSALDETTIHPNLIDMTDYFHNSILMGWTSFEDVAKWENIYLLVDSKFKTYWTQYDETLGDVIYEEDTLTTRQDHATPPDTYGGERYDTKGCWDPTTKNVGVDYGDTNSGAFHDYLANFTPHAYLPDVDDRTVIREEIDDSYGGRWLKRVNEILYDLTKAAFIAAGSDGSETPRDPYGWWDRDFG